MGSATVTLADVAATLGVSRTTVSNAYNRPDQLSPGLRDVAIVTGYTTGLSTGPEAQAASRWHVQSARLAGWRAGLETGGIDWSGVPVSGAGGATAAGAA